MNCSSGSGRRGRWPTNFNSTASLTHVAVNIICGRIVADDVEAVRAISAEVRDLMQDMEVGLANLDVKAVRSACNKARSVGQMLSPEAQQRLDFAIEAARKGATDIVKAGEQAAIEIDSSVLETIGRARTSFLDLDTNGAAVGAVEATGRALDFEAAAAVEQIQADIERNADNPVVVAALEVAARDIEMEV